MSPKGWRKNTSITRKLTEAPGEYQFLQAVRLLERSALYEKETMQSIISTHPIAGFSPPETESLRFHSNQSLAFPSSEIETIQRNIKSSGAVQWLLSVNVMGLTGAMGVLPHHYTEMMLCRQKLKDETMRHFFDLFNHRTLSLFFQASVKYRLPLQFERNRLHKPQKVRRDPQTSLLLSLIGLGTEGLSSRMHTRDESLINFSGLLNQKVRTSTGLQQILRSHFNIPVEIDQFSGQWQILIDDVRTRLASHDNPTGQNARLGRSAILGKKGWFAQGKIRIILGPLNRMQLNKFAPATRTLKALNELVRLYVGMEIDYDFIIRIYKCDRPEKNQIGTNYSTILGWNSWLSNRASDDSTINETIDISVSASRLI